MQKVADYDITKHVNAQSKCKATGQQHQECKDKSDEYMQRNTVRTTKQIKKKIP